MKAYAYLITILTITLFLALLVANDKINKLKVEVQKWENIFK